MIAKIGKAAFIAAVVSTSGLALGAGIDVDDRNAPGPIEVRANDFEYGLDVNGSAFQGGLDNPAIGSFPGGSLTFFGEFIDNGDTLPHSRTVYFVGAGDPSLALAVFTYEFSTAFSGLSVYLDGSYTSNLGGVGPVPLGVDPADVLPMGSTFTWSTTGFGGTVFTAPAPGAACLLALGGLVAARRRR